MIVNTANKDAAFFNEKVWPVVGSSLKIGTLEDYKNQHKLLKVLRWQSSASEGETATLDEYMSRRKQGQSQIFYIAGSGMERADLEKSPFVEKIIARGYEVLYFTVSTGLSDISNFESDELSVGPTGRNGCRQCAQL